MKSTFSKKVFEEGLIEINDTFEGATQKLKQIPYPLPKEMLTAISSSNNGESFSICKNSVSIMDTMPVYCNGEVVAQNGKTYLKYQIIYNKALSLFGIISSVIFAGFSILFLFGIKTKITDNGLLLAGCILALGLWLLFVNIKTSKYKKSDIDLIKAGVYKLADIINRWDE